MPHSFAEVDVWPDERIGARHETADARIAHRREATNALADMTVRGMSVEETARMAGMAGETVRDAPGT